MGSRIHLHRILFIALSTAFVGLLIEFTGEFDSLWALYAIPIMVAALTFHSAGAVLMTAISAALVGFHALDANVPVTDAAVVDAAIGIGAFFVAAMIVGVLTQRQQIHASELERTSVYDPLTGLYSASYFTTRLEEETGRRARYGGEMAVLLIELDDHREFKDTFGTRRADLLLEHLAEIMRISVRSTDVLARYGSGGFALICPHCAPPQAMAIAERLTALVAGTEFEGDELEPVTMHSVSVGIGTCPDPAHDAADVLALAEAGLAASRMSPAPGPVAHGSVQPGR